MEQGLGGLIGRFAGLRVLVVGDAMLDSYLDGRAERLCREAPVPVVTVRSRADQPGGAANTAANLAALGAEVALLAVVGDDADGAVLRHALRAGGVGDELLVVDEGRATLAKSRLSAASHLLVRFDQGDTGGLGRAAEARVIDRLSHLYGQCDALVISDYAYGLLTPAVIRAVAALNAADPRVVVADSKRLRAYKAVGLTAVKPNYAEAVRLLGPRLPEGSDGRVAAVAAHGAGLLEALNTRVAAITMDQEGTLVFDRDGPPYRTYAVPQPDSRAAGAGDTYVSALALALAAGGSTHEAAELAAAAAAVVVGRDGTAVCRADELREHVAAPGKLCASRERLAERVAAWRQVGRRVVFANGCFDILHRGHVTLLNRAKAMGDVLVVGVNDDAGVRRLKGPGRPVNGLEDRVQVLSALSSVDCLAVFAEETPAALIELVRPDVFVKGGDYTRERLPEAELVERLGGRVAFVPTVADCSTSGVIARIREPPRARAVGE
ncbi:MAG TPA: D-glycero-beta-D-manno-heptose 1-phosphate adenylyltransferase [Chloroflexaceae bacterium]|nr:D-glycero-beta-D-manno-heptose 1-phosphate adenylyltransferase [Chloroflexaceae bacterium]